MKKIDKKKRQYHINVGKRQLGPYTYDELHAFLKAGKIKDTTYVQRSGLYKWEYIRELPEFDKRKVEKIPKQLKEIVKADKKLISNTPTQEQWIIFDKNEKKGPYTENEVKQLVSANQIRRSSPAWKKGMPEWVKLNKLDVFNDVCYPAQPKQFDKDNVSYSDELDRSEIIDTSGIRKNSSWIVVVLLLIAIVIAGYKLVFIAKTTIDTDKEILEMMDRDSQIFKKEVTE